MADPAGTRPLGRSCQLGRRQFMAAIAGSLLAAPLAAAAQQAGKGYRIGFPTSSGPVKDSFLWDPLREALRERRWVLFRRQKVGSGL